MKYGSGGDSSSKIIDHQHSNFAVSWHIWAILKWWFPALEQMSLYFMMPNNESPSKNDLSGEKVSHSRPNSEQVHATTTIAGILLQMEKNRNHIGRYTKKTRTFSILYYKLEKNSTLNCTKWAFPIFFLYSKTFYSLTFSSSVDR